MRVLRRVGVISVVTASVVALSTAAKAEPRETAPPGLSHSFSHVDHGTRAQEGNGVPGKSRPSRGGSSSNGISYHGGPVLYNGVKVYLIWYGSWSGNTATTILPTLVSGLSGSPYYNINTTYSDSLNRKVPNLVTLGTQAFDSYSQGKSNLSDSAINAIVARAISTNALPSDPNGLYMVLTSADVTKSGFLTQYCGWHTNGTINSADIKYAFIGNPGSNGACSVQTSVSPNANVGADAMASIMAHELEETATDPDLNAWWDTRGYENADKCAWTFGTTYAVGNGSQANMKLGGLNFLIQRNWVNASGGYCALSY